MYELRPDNADMIDLVTLTRDSCSIMSDGYHTVYQIQVGCGWLYAHYLPWQMDLRYTYIGGQEHVLGVYGTKEEDWTWHMHNAVKVTSEPVAFDEAGRLILEAEVEGENLRVLSGIAGDWLGSRVSTETDKTYRYLSQPIGALIAVILEGRK